MEWQGPHASSGFRAATPRQQQLLMSTRANDASNNINTHMQQCRRMPVDMLHTHHHHLHGTHLKVAPCVGKGVAASRRAGWHCHQGCTTTTMVALDYVAANGTAAAAAAAAVCSCPCIWPYCCCC
jgi:hypothetical protein